MFDTNPFSSHFTIGRSLKYVSSGANEFLSQFITVMLRSTIFTLTSNGNDSSAGYGRTFSAPRAIRLGKSRMTQCVLEAYACQSERAPRKQKPDRRRAA